MVLCITGIPLNDDEEENFHDDRFEEYELFVRKLLEPRKIVYELLSLPIKKDPETYELLLSKLRDNGANIQPKFMAKVRLAESVIEEYAAEIARLRAEIRNYSADKETVEFLKGEISVLKKRQQNIDLRSQYVPSFSENRCHGITVRGFRCKNTLNCPHH